MSFTNTETKCLKTENPQTAVNRTKTEKRKFSWHKNRENDLKNSQNRKTDNTNATLLNSFPPLRVASISFILTISSPNNKLTSQEEGKCQCESDLRSNEHYLSSSENKALKKFRPVWDLNPWLPRYRCGALPSSTIFTSLSAVHIYDFHIVTVIYSSHHGFVWNQHNDQLPIGMLNQNKKKNI